MKTYPKLFILLLFVFTACSEDDNTKQLSGQQLLMKFDWIVFSWQPGPFIPETEPELEHRVWSFSETSYSGSDSEGIFFTLGDWNLEDDVLTLGDNEVIILELSREILVYQIEETGTIVTRLAVKKIDR